MSGLAAWVALLSTFVALDHSSPHYANAGGFVYTTCAERSPSNVSVKVQDYLYTKLHPPECKYKNMFRYMLPNVGLTARILHLVEGIVCAAVMDNFLYIHHNLVYINGNLCKSYDWDCYLQPFSNCSIEKTGKLPSLDERMKEKGVNDCFAEIREALDLPAWADNRWISKEVAQYVMRPNERMMNFMNMVAQRTSTRTPYITVQIRTGLRFTWANERLKYNPSAIEKQLLMAVDRAQKAGNASIFITTDYAPVVSVLKKHADPAGVSVYLVPPDLFPTSQIGHAQRAEQFLGQFYTKHPKSPLDEGLAWIANLFMLSQGFEAMVTLKSNIGHLLQFLMWCGTSDPPVRDSFPTPYGLPHNKKKPNGFEKRKVKK